MPEPRFLTPAAIPRVAGGAVIMIGVGALAGWQLDVAWLKSLAPGHAAVRPATAVAFLLLGTALWLSPGRASPPAGRWVTLGCAAAAVGIGLIRLTGYLLGFESGIEYLTFAQRVATTAGPGGGAAPQVALNEVLIGVALLLRNSHTRRAQLAVQPLALTSGALALVAVTGHAYGTRLLYGAAALNTALAFLMAAAGVLWSQPYQGLPALLAGGTPGGVLARHLLPAIIVIPLLLGWVRLLGQRAGLYDTEGGTAWFVVGTIVVLTGLTWWSARSLDRTDVRRHAAEQALRTTQARLQHTLASSTAVIYGDTVSGASFSPSWVSENITRMMGYDVHAATDPAWWPGHLHPDDRARVLAEVPALLKQDWHTMEYRFRHADGTYRWVHDECRLVRDASGAPLEVFGAWMDITERKQAEEALRVSEERFRALAVTANDAIISANISGVITYFNPAAQRIFGYAPEEAMGQPLTTLMPERFREAHSAGLARYVATGEARVVGKTVEVAGRKKDGTEFPLELSLASWKHGRDVAFTAIIRDITERKRVDETLRRYAAQLEAANAELDAFAYSVSHDLRAPLRSMDGFSQALLEDCAELLDAKGQDYLRRVRTGSQRMAELIDDLLKLSRVTRSQMQVGPVDLSAIAGGIAAELEKTEPSRHVKFEITPDLVVQADPGLMRVALQNLLGNAWKFTAKRPDARIEFGVTSRDGQSAYFVRDNGAGFDMTYADKLFGAFQRLHGATEFEGTGIGLATVQRIVHRHGGRVWAEGAAERGATFYFTL